LRQSDHIEIQTLSKCLFWIQLIYKKKLSQILPYFHTVHSAPVKIKDLPAGIGSSKKTLSKLGSWFQCDNLRPAGYLFMIIVILDYAKCQKYTVWGRYSSLKIEYKSGKVIHVSHSKHENHHFCAVLRLKFRFADEYEDYEERF
jgi:hypothetical protein